MTRTEADRLAQRIVADRRRGFPPGVVLMDVFDNVPADNPEHCPQITLVYQVRGQWYAGRVKSEREYITLMATAQGIAARVSLN